MTNLVRTFVYKKDEDHGEYGWALKEMTGFNAITVQDNPNDSIRDRWAMVFTHDAIEHDPGYLQGKIANEIHALGAMWGNRNQYEGTVDDDSTIHDLSFCLEMMNCDMEDVTGDHDAMLEVLDRQIPLIDFADNEGSDILLELVTRFIDEFRCDWFTAGDRMSQVLIGRIFGHMCNGTKSFNDKFSEAIYGGVFQNIQHDIEQIFGSVEDVLSAIGREDLEGYIDEFWEGFTVILTIDTVSLNVTATVDNTTAYGLDDIAANIISDDDDDDDD